MPRSGREAHERLQRAALELYAERGFDQITTAEIAERAGVTERTFFRHFPDKREVLFGGEAFVRELLVAAVDDAPPALGSLEALRTACLSLEAPLQESREFSKPRHTVISATPALRERELTKMSTLADALAGALRRRGVADQKASLAAIAAVSALNAAVTSWYEDPSKSIRALINQAFDDLLDLTAAVRSSVLNEVRMSR